MTAPVEVARGDGPVVLGVPHTGSHIPQDVWARLNETGRARADTDWHVERLYEGLPSGATTVRATIHRYAIDANRDPEGASLYPGQNTTGLCPLTDFDGRAFYLDGQEPDADEIARRRAIYHRPYHAALKAELDRVRALHGAAVLYDCHSIRSRIPFLFEGRLPDFNIGTNGGASCARAVEAAAAATAGAAEGYTSVTNGRFKGGWTTRHYGRPADGLHAIQMELAQCSYLAEEAPPWRYDEAKADRLRHHLSEILTRLAALIPNQRGT